MKIPYVKLFWLCVAAVLVLSLLPVSEQLPSTGWDKSNHLLGFGVLAMLGGLAYPGRHSPVLVGLLAYGGLIELLQALTPHRFAEWGDLLADALGIVVGYLALRLCDLLLGKQALRFLRKQG